MKSQRRKTTTLGLRNVFALGVVSFFTDTSSEMVFGLLPAFIVDELGASLGLLGLIEGVAEALGYYLRMFSGVLSDRLRTRKILVLLGYSFSSVAKPFFAVARSWTDAFLVRVVERTGKGVRTAPRDALLSASVERSVSGRAFGIHRALDQTGAIVGPLLAFALLPLIGLRNIFLVSILPGGLAVVVLLLFVKERAGKRRKVKLLANLREVLRGRFRRLLVVVALFSLGAYNFSFILIKSTEFGLATVSIPLTFAVINVAHTLVAAPAGILSDRVGKGRVLGIGYATFLVASLLAATLSREPAYAFLIATVYGAYVGIVETVSRALIPEYTTPGLEGTAYGFYYLVVGTFFFAANGLMGVLWDLFGSSVAFLFPVATSTLALIALFVAKLP